MKLAKRINGQVRTRCTASSALHMLNYCWVCNVLVHEGINKIARYVKLGALFGLIAFEQDILKVIKRI